MGPLVLVSWPAVFLATASAFVLGGLWYSPLLFDKAWRKATKLTDADIQSGHPAKTFGGAFVLSFIAALIFAVFLGQSPGIVFGTAAGFAAGLFWVASSFGINYLFEKKPLSLFLINGGFHTVQFTLYGLIIGWLQ